MGKKARQRRAAIYARVSTDEQATAAQVMRLREVADRAGWDVVATYDETASGAGKRRPAIERLMQDAARRRFDVVMAFDVSRLGRSLSHLVGVFETFRTLGVDLYLDRQGFDTSTAAGRMAMQMCAVFAEFEREMIVERTKAGMAKARARGSRIGRPPASPAIVAAIRSMRSQGLGMDAIARELKVGKGVSQRVCQEFDREQMEVS